MSRKLDAAVAELLGYDVYWQKPFDELEPYIMVDGAKLTRAFYKLRTGKEWTSYDD